MIKVTLDQSRNILPFQEVTCFYGLIPGSVFNQSSAIRWIISESHEFSLCVMQTNEDHGSASEHSKTTTPKACKTNNSSKKTKPFGLSEVERARLQTTITAQDLINLELTKDRDYANTLADRLNLLQIRMDQFEHRLQSNDKSELYSDEYLLILKNPHEFASSKSRTLDDSEPYSDDYLLKNPHQIASSKFRSLDETKKINSIVMVEQSYFKEYNFGERIRYYPIMDQVQILSAVFSCRNFLARHLLDYETALFCRLLWPVFDYAYPKTCKFMMMICIHNDIEGIKRHVPFVVEVPNEYRRTFVFKCYLHEFKMFTHL